MPCGPIAMVGAVAAAEAAAEAAEADDAADAAARGKRIYARAGCIGCHGLGGAGGYPNNNAKGGVVPSLNKVYETYTKSELIAKIKRGVPNPQKADPAGPAPMLRMPAWGEKLDASELDSVATYLMTLRPNTIEKSDW